MRRVGEDATILATCRSGAHNFSKQLCEQVEAVEGLGIAGDAHAGDKVQHLSRVRANPDQPNLRQVHLIHAELFDELAQHGFAIQPGNLGENLTTRGIDLLGLGRDTILRVGPDVVLRVTGLRNPCAQIERFAPGLLKHLALKSRGEIIRKAGIMTTVMNGGTIRPGDGIDVEPPAGPYVPLEVV